MRVFWKIFPVVLTALILCIKEWDTLQHLNTVFFGNYHDALKNYYTVLYHIKWDISYLHFEGMNYPFGEHVLFTDNQPLLSNTIKFIQNSFFDISPYVLGILNGAVFFSFLLAAWFSNLVLRELDVKDWYAALIAVGIVFLAPQFNRIERHFGLSYSFIIPMFIYLGMRHLSHPTWRRSLLIGIAAFAVGLLHAYNFGFAILISGVVFLVAVFKKQQHPVFSVAHFGLQCLLPLVGMQLFMFFSDSIADRPAYPWSPFIGNFQPEGFLVSYNSPLGLWLHHKLNMRHVNWEAEAYLGMATLILLVIIIVFSLAYFRRKWRHYGLPLILKNPKQTFVLCTGLAAIALSLSFSLLSSNTEIYQLMGPLRQFRAVGRFHWVTFFAFNFLAFAWAFQVLKNRRKTSRWALLIVLLGLLTYDAYEIYNEPYHTEHQVPMLMENSTEQEQMEAALKDFDVIIPLPYFHIGSEDFLLTAEDSRYYKDAMAVSYASGIPLTSINLSRTSLAQSLAQLTYSIWPLENPPYLNYLKNKEALLLVQKGSNLTLNEELIISAGGGDTLFENQDFYLQSVDMERYARQHASKDSIYNYLKHGSGEVYTLQNYEAVGSHSFVGVGSKKLVKEEKPLIESLEVPKGATKAKIGLWVYLNQPTKTFDDIELVIINKDKTEEAPQKHRIVNELKALHEEWGYVEVQAELPAQAKQIEVRADPNGLHPTETYVDMLRVYFFDGNNNSINSSGPISSTPTVL